MKKTEEISLLSPLFPSISASLPSGFIRCFILCGYPEKQGENRQKNEGRVFLRFIGPHSGFAGKSRPEDVLQADLAAQRVPVRLGMTVEDDGAVLPHPVQKKLKHVFSFPRLPIRLFFVVVMALLYPILFSVASLAFPERQKRERNPPFFSSRVRDLLTSFPGGHKMDTD